MTKNQQLTQQGHTSGIFIALLAITVLGAVIGMVAFFSMPILSCGPIDMKLADFGDNTKTAAYSLCMDVGGREHAASGMWFGLLGGGMFFGGGIGVWLHGRNAS